MGLFFDLPLLLLSGAVGFPFYYIGILPTSASRSRDHMIVAIESGEIDLNYLLNDVVEEIVVKVKQHALADLGNLSRLGNKAEPGELDPLQLSEMALQGVGLKNPGPMLTIKMAQILGTMADKLLSDKKGVNNEVTEIPNDDNLFKP